MEQEAEKRVKPLNNRVVKGDKGGTLERGRNASRGDSLRIGSTSISVANRAAHLIPGDVVVSPPRKFAE